MKLTHSTFAWLLVVLLTLTVIIQSHRHWSFHSSVHASGIVTVDVTDLTQQFVIQLAKSHRTPAEQQQAIKQFAERLQQALIQMSQQQHVVIVPAQAVIAGARDETAAIAKAIGMSTKGGEHGH